MCTARRQPHFLDPGAVELVRVQLLHASGRDDVAVIAYCFMPDHLHLVVEGQTDEADLVAFCRVVRSRSGFHWKQAHGRELWQEGFHDRILRVEEHTPAIVRYVIQNPVRAGLAERCEEFANWGSLVCSREELLDYVAFA